MINEDNSEEDIFRNALQFKNRDEQKNYVKEVCGDDTELRAAVDALLRHHYASSILDVPALESSLLHETTALIEGPGTVIGNYKLLEQIGEGGMAVVYMAEQKRPIRRKVALKIIKLGMDTKSVIARFEAERQALALMDHPNIAKVLDAGATETGRPYFVMELVRGISITEYCDKNNLSTKERLDLFISICSAVQHAHQKGIIHRDIKPTNVMVTLHDGEPMAKVIDFGIAKATNQQLTERTLFTKYAQMIGTPIYMSPEQAEMSALDIDTRTDVYSLGVLLYELLTGTTPFDADKLREAGYGEIQRIIREEEPPKPSTRLSTMGEELTIVAKHRHSSPDLLTKLIRGDLDWIVMKSLEKDRTRRYGTTAELATDIEHHLNHEPVQAAAPSLLYKARKFVQRNLASVMAAAGILLSLTVGLVVSTVMYYLAEQAREETATALQQSQYWLYVLNIRAAQNAIEHPVTASAKGYLNRCPKEFRNWEWHRLNWLADRSIRTFRVYKGGVRSVAFSPDGKHIFSCGFGNTLKDHIIKVCNANTGEELVTLSGERHEIVCVAFSPDGKSIASGGRDGSIKLWDATTGEELMTFRGHLWRVISVAFSPDSKRIVSASGDWTIKVWDIVSGSIIGSIKVWDVEIGGDLRKLFRARQRREGKSDVRSVAFSPDSKRIVSGSGDGIIKIWDAYTGEELMNLSGHEGIHSVVYSPDGKRIVSGSTDKTIKVWDAETGADLITLRGHEGGVNSVAFSPDSKRIVSGSLDKTIKLWDAATGEEFMTFLGHEHKVASAAFSPDGQRIVSGSKDGTIKVWDAAMDKEPVILRGHENQILSLAFSPDSKRIVSANLDGTIKVWDTDSGEKLMNISGHKEWVRSVAYSPDGKLIASGSGDKTIKLWDADKYEELMNLQNEKAIISIAFSPDGTRIVSGGWEENIRIWEVATGTELTKIRGDEKWVTSVAFSPDGQRIFSCSDDNIKVWDIETGEELISILRRVRVNAQQPIVAISPDGELILSGITDLLTFESKIKLWDANTGKELMTLRGHEGFVTTVAFSPDGERIASGGSGETIKIWDTVKGEELMNLGGHMGGIRVVAFSPDGKYIASTDEGNTIRIWNCGPH
ncbi:MAG: WD40 domain-containing protein [Planctomycetota bacterium]